MGFDHSYTFFKQSTWNNKKKKPWKIHEGCVWSVSLSQLLILSHHYRKVFGLNPWPNAETVVSALQ